MRKILIATAVIMTTFSYASTDAKAGEYCTSASSCKAQVMALVREQDSAALVGGQWRVSESACASAANQQKANEHACRMFDKKYGGKTLAECAQCYRQVREDIRRWIACHKASGGKVPMTPAAIYKSRARLGAAASGS